MLTSFRIVGCSGVPALIIGFPQCRNHWNIWGVFDWVASTEASAWWRRVRSSFCHTPANLHLVRSSGQLFHVGTRKGKPILLKQKKTDAILYCKLLVTGIFAARRNEWRLCCATTQLIVWFNVLSISFHFPQLLPGAKTSSPFLTAPQSVRINVKIKTHGWTYSIMRWQNIYGANS